MTSKWHILNEAKVKLHVRVLGDAEREGRIGMGTYSLRIPIESVEYWP